MIDGLPTAFTFSMCVSGLKAFSKTCRFGVVKRFLNDIEE